MLKLIPFDAKVESSHAEGKAPRALAKFPHVEMGSSQCCEVPSMLN